MWVRSVASERIGDPRNKKSARRSRAWIFFSSWGSVGVQRSRASAEPAALVLVLPLEQRLDLRVREVEARDLVEALLVVLQVVLEALLVVLAGR